MFYSSKLKYRGIYFPGQISLAVLRLIFAGFLVYEGMFTSYAAITVTWLDKKSIATARFRDFAMRKYISFSLTGVERQDRTVLANFRILSSEIAGTRDSTHGVRLLLSKHTRYNELIKAIDLCNGIKDEKYRWFLYENQVIGFYAQHLPEEDLMPSPVTFYRL